MSWVEARLQPDAHPDEVYRWLDEPPELVHHFWDEPWWPGAYVIRMDGVQANLGDCPAISHLALWDESPDKQMYAAWFPWVLQFFQAGSILAGAETDHRHQGKLVHCYLNAQGLSVRDEFWFGLRFAWGRLTLRPRLWWRGLWE